MEFIPAKEEAVHYITEIQEYEIHCENYDDLLSEDSGSEEPYCN